LSVSRAWPVKFVAGNWDNEANVNHENIIESVTPIYNYFELGVIVNEILPVML